jgi:hypothetical protein
MTDYNGANQELSLESYDLTKSTDIEIKLPQNVYDSVMNIVQESKGNGELCNEYAQKAISFLEQADRGIDTVNANSNSWGRLWGAITGSRERQHIVNETMLANAQKACVQLILEMNKQFLLSQEQIRMLQYQMERQIGQIVSENKEFRKKLFQVLQGILVAVDNRFIRIEKSIGSIVNKVKDHDERIDLIVNEIRAIENHSYYFELCLVRICTNLSLQTQEISLILNKSFNKTQEQIEKLMTESGRNLDLFDKESQKQSEPSDDLAVAELKMKQLKSKQLNTN